MSAELIPACAANKEYRFLVAMSVWSRMVMPKVLFAILAAAFCASAQAESTGPLYYKPGDWAPLPWEGAGEVVAPGTTTVIPPTHADVQYALPMASPWQPALNGVTLDAKAVPDRAWLAAMLYRGSAGSVAVSQEAILQALPAGSQLVPLDDIRRGVPEPVDLIVAYDFSESQLQSQERQAVEEFVRRGGTVLFLFASRAIPAASVELWRGLFQAEGVPEKQAPGLPRGFLVPREFSLHFLEEEPRLVWKRCGRGVVAAYGLSPNEDLLDDKDRAAELFGLAFKQLQENRRPLSLGPVEPDAFVLFDSPAWSESSRRPLAWLAAGYAAGAIGLLVSFAGLLARRRWLWLAALVGVAAAGAGVVYGFTAEMTGLSLDTASMVIHEPDAPPSEVTLARITRLGPGPDPQLESAGAMPPRLLLYSRYSANQRNWINYRFLPSRSTSQPVLDIGQSLCLGQVRELSPDDPAAQQEEVSEPPHGDRLMAFFQKHCASRNVTYSFRWVQPAGPPRPFAPSASRRLVQVRRQPVLVVQGEWTPSKPRSESGEAARGEERVPLDSPERER